MPDQFIGPLIFRNAHLNKKEFGCILGAAIGDAIGEIAQHKNWTSISWSYISAKVDMLSYTDDTAMTIAVLESLIENGGIDPEFLGRRLHINWALESDRGYSSGPPAIFFNVEKKSITYIESAEFVNRILYGPHGSRGDGAAMRAHPIGIYHLGKVDTHSFLRDIYNASVVTHINPIAIDGAILVACSIQYFGMVSADRPIDIDSYFTNISQHLKTTEMTEALEKALEFVKSNKEASDVAVALGNTELLRKLENLHYISALTEGILTKREDTNSIPSFGEWRKSLDLPDDQIIEEI
jgi:poly(ADP-ribose) glycohydrolase ARH3